MTRVFISYALADEADARYLAHKFEAANVEFFMCGSEQERGKPFIEHIELQMQKADAFVPLLSPAFYASAWCRREREMALRRETHLRRASGDQSVQIIYVAQVGHIDPELTDMLGAYDRFDLLSNREEESSRLVSRIADLSEHGTSTPTTDSASTTQFRNRNYELTQVTDNLANPDGEHFWAILSPPQLGKSWFLDELHIRMKEQVVATESRADNERWNVTLFDLNDRSVSLRSDPGRLLAALFGDNANDNVEPTQYIRTKARQIVATRRPHLCMLDGAELVGPETAIALRTYLGELRGMVEAGFVNGVHFAFVAASRWHEDWLGVLPAPGFRLLELTRFSLPTVNAALRDATAGRNLGSTDRARYAREIFELSEGLPGLLAESIDWLRRHEFIDMRNLSSPETFDRVARPYIERTLLTNQVLLPFASARFEQESKVLHDVVEAIAPYRILTESHISHQIEINPDLASRLQICGWNERILWMKLSESALLQRTLEDLWEAIDPPIRRLLHRYFYSTAQEQADAHGKARDFYASWHRLGRESDVAILECLWHETSRLLFVERGDISDQLLSFLDRTIADFSNAAVAYGLGRPYSQEHLARKRLARLKKDRELQLALGSYAGLSEQVSSRLGRPWGEAP